MGLSRLLYIVALALVSRRELESIVVGLNPTQYIQLSVQSVGSPHYSACLPHVIFTEYNIH